MEKELDNFTQERKSIQARFERILRDGLSDDFIEYYNTHLKDERYSIDQKNFEVRGATDSYNLEPPLKQIIKDGKIGLLLDEGRCDFDFFLEGTKNHVPEDRKYKWGGYFYVYRYIAQFEDLELDECIYLYKLSKLRSGAFFYFGITDEYKHNMPALLRLNKNIPEKTVKGLELLIKLEPADPEKKK